jgi:hypothetical protein
MSTKLTRRDFLHRSIAVAATCAVATPHTTGKGTHVEGGVIYHSVPADELARLAKIEGFRFILVNGECQEIPTGGGYVQGGIPAIRTVRVEEIEGQLIMQWNRVSFVVTGPLPANDKPIRYLGLVGNGHLLALWDSERDILSSAGETLHFDNVSLRFRPNVMEDNECPPA